MKAAALFFIVPLESIFSFDHFIVAIEVAECAR